MIDNTPSQLFISYLKIILLIAVGTVTMYLTNLLSAILLGPEQFGDFTVIIKLLLFLAPFILLGSHSAMIYFVPQYANKQGGLDKQYIIWSIKRVSICSLMFLLLLFCFLSLVYFLHQFNIHTIDKWHAVIYALWVAPLLAFLFIIRNIFLSYNRVILNELLTIIPFVSLLAIVVLLYFFRGSATIYEIIYALAIALALFIAICTVFIRPYLLSRSATHLSSSTKKEWAAMAYQMCIGSLVFSGLLAIDTVCLEYFGTYEHEVGHYGAILAIGSIAMIFNCWIALIAPHISASIQSNNLKPLSKAIITLRGFSFIYLIVTCILVTIFGKTLLAHFGPSYIADYPALLVFLFGSCFIVLMSGSGAILYNSGHQNVVIKAAGIEIILMFILSWILIPRFEIMGAVMAYLIDSILASIYLLYQQKKRIGINQFFLSKT